MISPRSPKSSRTGAPDRGELHAGDGVVVAEGDLDEIADGRRFSTA